MDLKSIRAGTQVLHTHCAWLKEVTLIRATFWLC